jgi:signal transduction histidine kinase
MSESLESSPLSTHDYQPDIDAIARIDAIPTILDVVCRTTGLGFAAVARVTEDRWIACRVLDNIDFGLQPGSELSVESTICHEIRQNREPVVIDDVAEDEAYRGHHTPATYRFRSYISMPIITKDGKFFGTLCAIDPRPARLKNPETIGMFKLFAELIASHLDNDEKLKASLDRLTSSTAALEVSRSDLVTSKAQLLEERNIAELREQFIAVLGHDLRNPLAAIGGGIHLLRRDPPAERRKLLLEMLEGSTFRMGVLIDNVLDFARGRLGSGIPLDIRPQVALVPVLEQVVSELRLGMPNAVIETEFDLPGPVKCDPSRIGQLVSNLLGNALSHGKPGEPVRVHAGDQGGTLTIWIANAGTPIPSAAMERLFQPFFRGEFRSNQQGLGLGLHIASEIAKAHGGTLDVVSADEETRFTFRMPTAAT